MFSWSNGPTTETCYKRSMGRPLHALARCRWVAALLSFLLGQGRVLWGWV